VDALKSLHHNAAEQLRELIFNGQLAAGSYLDEPKLCELLAISRTPLREALKVLASEGLVRHEPRRGSFVSQVTEQDLDELFPIIAMLEGRCAYEAALRASPADVAVLTALHEQLTEHAKNQAIQAYFKTNYAIHEAIITLANNRWLSQVIGDLRKVLKLARLQQLSASGRLEQSLSEHLAVFAAIKAKDANSAMAAMQTHITRQRQALKDLANSKASSIALPQSESLV
jgi:DNA-binding GntR family transcriptional regulator